MHERRSVSARGVGTATLAGALTLALLGAGEAPAKPHPAKPRPPKVRCAGKRATIVGTPRADRLVAHGPGTQVIAGLGGNDRIVTKRGADVACGGGGNDRIYLGRGNDGALGARGDDEILGGSGNDGRLDGGGGTDSIAGGAGADALHGGPGNDVIDGGGAADPSLEGEAGNDEILGGPGSDLTDGGPGADRLFAGLQDDSLLGGDGNDLVVGGHGVDDMNGGNGNDLLRGGLNRDTYVGDQTTSSPGSDTASFATAMPPGASAASGNPDEQGVEVTLNAFGAGIADGDEAPGEPLAGIENVIGSQFDDQISRPGGGTVDGGLGSDTCSGFRSASGCGSDPRSTAMLYVTGQGGPDPGLVMLGQTASSNLANDAFRATPVSGGVKITYPVSAGTLDVGRGCSRTSTPGQYLCATRGKLGWVIGWGESGNDSFSIGSGFDPSTEILIDGGGGDDTLTGGPTDEQFLAGADGEDTLTGNGGDDALFARGADGDTLSGGDGNDQFVVDNACGGHHLIGGPGAADVAGFGAETADVRATLGGAAYRIGSSSADLCPSSHTTIDDDSEVLEGGSYDDVLTGDQFDNPLILGRAGDDVIHGGGGDDYLRGLEGADRLFGDDGADQLDAKDGEVDPVIDCGRGGLTATRDGGDPAAAGC